MPSESDGGNGNQGTSGATSAARGGDGSQGGGYSQAQDSQQANADAGTPYANYTTGDAPATVPISQAELPNQSPAQQEAAANLLRILGYAPTVAGIVNPAFGLAMNVGQGIANFTNSDQSIGDAATQLAKSLATGTLLAKLGPLSTLAKGTMDGDLGKGAGDTVNGLMTAALAGQLHLPAGLVGMGLKAVGANDAVGGQIAGAVNGVAAPANDAARSLFGRDTAPVGALTRTASASAPTGAGSYHDPVYG